MLIHPLDQVKNLVEKIKDLEDKLVNTSFLTLEDQKKLHQEIKRHKDEIELLERRTRQRQ